jgi:hypothetical protein
MTSTGVLRLDRQPGDPASNFGNPTEIYNGFDVNMNARFGGGVAGG